MGPHHFRGNFQDHLKNILGEEIFSGAVPSASEAGEFPKINLYESKQKIYIIARLPGLKDPTRLNISIMGSVISLKGIIDELYRDEAITVRIQECFYGEFDRRINLPVAVSGIGTVNYQNGILSVELVKEDQSGSVNVKVQF
jgi:HSP20 family molecular chaperone IbpA